MKEKERVKTATSAMGSAVKGKMNRASAHQETSTRADMNIVKEIIDSWGSFPKKVATDTIEKYGAPNEAIPSQLIWYDNGPWKKTRVLRDEVPHNFPQPHTDVIENTINYEIPPEYMNDLSVFDTSLYIDRTRGEAAARCDMEAANMISLNLMNDIINDKLSVEEARKKFGEIASAYMMDKPAPYAEALQFQITDEETSFQDEAKIGKAMMHQAGEKIKNKFDS